MRPATLLAVLVCLAGCSAFAVEPGPSPTPTGTVTPAPVPGDPVTRTPVAAPPAALRDGVDADALAQAHADSLEGRNYTFEAFRNSSADRPDRWNVEQAVVRVAGPTRYRAQRSRIDRQPRLAIRFPRTATYADGERVYVRDERIASDAASYTVGPVRSCSGGEGVYADAAEGLVERYLAVENATVERVRTDAGVRFEVVGRGSRTLRAVRGYHVEATVTPAGRVERLRATFEGGNGTVTVGFAYRRVGTTVAPPPFWYETARERAAPGETGAGCRGDCEPFPGGRAVGEGRCAVPTPTPGPPGGPIPSR